MRNNNERDSMADYVARVAALKRSTREPNGDSDSTRLLGRSTGKAEDVSSAESAFPQRPRETY